MLTQLNVLPVRIDVVVQCLSLPWVHFVLIFLLFIIIAQVFLKVLLYVFFILDFFLLFHSP